MKDSSSSEYVVTAKAEVPAYWDHLVLTPHARVLQLLVQSTHPAAVLPSCGCRSAYPGGPCSTRLHKPLLSVKAGVQIPLAKGRWPSQAISATVREGRVPSGHPSILGQHPFCPAQRIPLTGLSLSEPAQVHLLTRKGTGVIGEHSSYDDIFHILHK